ncbi:NmrA family protein [Colletotrichum lupini]|uniref:NmrA family protein n=1 Tax=Colletotrichum lupini TaxID=145971 RepID=A0A9Q8WDY4_9PEZI|nr:NmrA family protein [Colletotrichum lupini]UQC79145.1 NmrA family protein [Colletotrichum lupini]
MSELQQILVIGGTGAQGRPVVKALAETRRYSVRVLTRNVDNARAKELAALPNVTLIQGKQDSQQDLHRAFKGVYGAWVNTDGFTLGQKSELFYGIRAYEIARHEGVQHYVWAGTDYALKKSGWNEKYHWGHNDSKGRVTDFILAQGQDGMKSSVLTTGPYMDMLLDGMFPPTEQPDGSFLWVNPAKDGKIPLIALEDVGIYSLWLFDNLNESAGLNLEVTTDEVSFADIARIFTEVTGKKGIHKSVPFEEYAPLAEPYPGAYVNFSVGPEVARDESDMTWRQNFGAWWRFWGEGIVNKRDLELLDRIHPGRIRSLAEWMRKTGQLITVHSGRYGGTMILFRMEYLFNLTQIFFRIQLVPSPFWKPKGVFMALSLNSLTFDEIPGLIPPEHSAALYYLQPKDFNLNLSWAKKLVDVFDYSIQELKEGIEPKVMRLRHDTVGDDDPEPDASFWDDFFERVLGNLGHEAEKFGMTSLDVINQKAGYWRKANLHHLHDLLPEWVEMLKTKKLRWTNVFGELFGIGR